MSAAVENNISAKQAAKMAIDFVEGFYRDLGTPVLDIMLEELEPSEDDLAWQITVGFSSSPHVPESPIPVWARKNDRHYKVVQVNRGTGEIRSMKIRHVEAL